MITLINYWGGGKFFLTECLFINLQGMLRLGNHPATLKHLVVKVCLGALYSPSLQASPHRWPRNYRRKRVTHSKQEPWWTQPQPSHQYSLTEAPWTSWRVGLVRTHHQLWSLPAQMHHPGPNMSKWHKTENKRCNKITSLVSFKTSRSKFPEEGWEQMQMEGGGREVTTKCTACPQLDLAQWQTTGTKHIMGQLNKFEHTHWEREW